MHFEFQVSGFTGFGLEQIASSKAGFNTNSSQFFITFEAWLATRECSDLYGFLCAQPPCDLNLNIVYIHHQSYIAGASMLSTSPAMADTCRDYFHLQTVHDHGIRRNFAGLVNGACMIALRINRKRSLESCHSTPDRCILVKAMTCGFCSEPKKNSLTVH